MNLLKALETSTKYQNNSKLRSFQFRLLNFAITLNTSLYRWNIIDNNRCYMCMLEEETTEHFFYFCETTQKLLHSIVDIVEDYHKERLTLDINLKNVILNRVHEKPGHLANTILLSLKSYLYSSRCTNSVVSLPSFRRVVENDRKCEYYNARNKSKCNYYYKKWFNVINNVQLETYENSFNTEDLAQNYLIDCILFEQQ